MNILGSTARQALHALAHTAVVHVVDDLLPEEHKGRGGYFRAFLIVEPRSYKDLVVLHEGWIGGRANISHESLYRICSIEKVIRLANHVSDGHMSSFESRVPNEMYAGAIKFRCKAPDVDRHRSVWLMFSLSGLPELADEAAMLCLAESLFHIGWEPDRSDLKEIFRRSKNSIYRGELMGPELH